jgi:hypothetical protein
MFYENLQNRGKIVTTATFEEAMIIARTVIARARAATLRIEDGCMSLYTDGTYHGFEKLPAVVFARTDGRYWNHVSATAYETGAFDLGVDCPVENANLHIYLRFEAAKRKYKPLFDDCFQETFGVICPVSNINLELIIDGDILTTVLEPWVLARYLKPTNTPKLFLINNALITAATFFECGIDDMSLSVVTTNIHYLGSAVAWNPIFQKGPPKPREYVFHVNYRGDGLDFAIARGATHSISFLPTLKLLQSVLSRVMTIVDTHWPEQKIKWTAGTFSSVAMDSDRLPASQTQKLCFDDYSDQYAIPVGPPEISAAHQAPLIEIGRAYNSISRYVVFALNIHHFAVKSDPIFFQFTLLDAIVTAVDQVTQINSRAALGAMAFMMGPLLEINEELCVEEDTAAEVVLQQLLLPPPQKHAAPPRAKSSSESAAKGQSTVMAAWNLILEQNDFPVVRHASEQEKIKKTRNIVSRMRGNRFAKPLEGTAHRGGNNRDPKEKMIHVFRELKEAAWCGINRDEFFNLMNETGVLYTKTSRREETAGQGD